MSLESYGYSNVKLLLWDKDVNTEAMSQLKGIPVDLFDTVCVIIVPAAIKY